jgi:hypothetical protein
MAIYLSYLSNEILTRNSKMAEKHLFVMANKRSLKQVITKCAKVTVLDWWM